MISTYFSILASKLPINDNKELLLQLEQNCNLIILNKNESLIEFQAKNKQIYFVVEGSFVRNIVTSKGEQKTIMFHTDSFHEFFKSYDTIYFHQNTNYTIKANERSVVLSFDFDFLFALIQKDKQLLEYYTHKTEALFVTLDLFRNFQLGLTSEEYLTWLYESHSFLFKIFPAQNIASFMGITPVWLSKLKSKNIY